MLLKMFRVHPALATVLLLCLVINPPVFAQDEQPADEAPSEQPADLTAADLLQQAIQQYQAGEYETAQQTLQRIDRIQLTDDEKQTYDQTRQAITGFLGGKDKLANAEAAENSNDLQKAKQLYRELTADTNAPRKVRQQALNGLARVERRLMGEAAPSTAPAMQSIPPALPESTPGTPSGIPMSPQQAQVLSEARQLRAQELTAQANAAADGGNYNEANRLYTQALELDPTNEQASTGLQNVKVLLHQDAGQGNVLDTEVTMYKLQRQRAIARYEVAIGEAKQAVGAGNYSQAADAVSLAKSILDTNRQFIPESEYSQLRQQALDLGAQVSQQSEQARIANLTNEQQQVAQRQQLERIQAEQQKHDKVQELLRRARDLSREQQYEQALEQIAQIKFIDPQNDAAEFMDDLITDQMIQTQYVEVERLQGRSMAEARLNVARDTIPHQELMLYPPDWPELSERRLESQSQSVDTEVNRIVREKLQQSIPIDFRANRLETVVEYFRNVTGVNFFVQWRALEAAGIARDTPITMQLQNVAGEKALTLILDEAGGDFVDLGYAVDEGVVVIATREFLAGKTEIRTYDIRDLIVEVPEFTEAPELDLGVTADSGSPFGGGGGGEEETATPEERIAQIMDLLRNSVDPDNWREAGGTTSSMAENNGILIVNTTSENHRGISNLLGQLREQSALLIAVDGRYLFVTQNFLEEVGLDVDITWDDTPSWLDGPVVIDNNSAENARAPGTSIPGTLGPLDLPLSPFTTAMTVGSGGLGSLGFILDDLQVDVFLRATQMDQRNVQVNTPRLTLFNGQRAYVTITQDTSYVSDLNPVVADGVGLFDVTIDVVRDGVVLDIQATISADRRYITMTIRSDLAQLISLDEFESAGVIPGDDDGGIPPSVFTGTLQLPTLSITQVRTTVSVPDKGTLMVGGQRLMGEIEIESGVPVLSKIPFINRLFTNRSTTRDERTLLILIKPTIIVQSEEEDRLFPGLNQSPELYNVGVRP